ncbi:deoxycytidine triphosphate deaminase [Bradyrhizobium sp. 35]|uniref:dCTP deaminase domain-containing protein n=2 Tax=unclassified Bradyrhizobium TaxID=2631580 RepID=UPI001FFA425E|nr:deoxycytidine triphosphate deaminase [Bradyrhizobium sp. 35]MCK1451942.1 deoxycytidine triphosphate deaminase [Bradyrhizobium sp. 35]UPK20364.1 deoxycytidine triphosphate deaminase [Bradyrhizobium sp. 131]
MTFWSGEKLAERLNELVEPADLTKIDCASYTLSVGPEYFVTPTDQTSDAKSRSLMLLAVDQAFAIPPGQFAYIQTDEIVKVPRDALAFISIRARIKWKGLVNVSGFHVDPGFNGRLTFAVFNAGPSPIHLRRGERCFLIWYADLDRTSNSVKNAAASTHIDLLFVNSISGELHSLDGLAERIRTTDKELSLRISSLERSQGIVTVAASIFLTLIAGLTIKLAVDFFLAKQGTNAPAPTEQVQKPKAE